MRQAGRSQTCLALIGPCSLDIWQAASSVLCRLLAVAAEQVLENHESLNVWFVASFFLLLLCVIHKSQICMFFWSKLELPRSLTRFCHCLLRHVWFSSELYISSDKKPISMP